ncbi:MAG: hypothetical protein RJB66_445 [Pseudomonadota bacterium]
MKAINLYQTLGSQRSLWLLSTLNVLMIAVVISLQISCSNSRGGRNPTANSTGLVEKKDLIQRVTIAGFIEPLRTTTIAAPYTGYIKKLYINVGDPVKVGTSLVSVTQSLLGTQEVYPMRSPINGIIVQINKSEGEFVRDGDIKDFILRIDDPSQYIIKAQTPEIDRIKLRVGQNAIIKVNAINGKTYKGVIRSIAQAPSVKDSRNSSTVEYSTIVDILDADELIRTGMSTLIDLIVEKKEKALTLRHEFIQRDKNGFFVTKANGDRQNITVGIQNEEAFEILSGLNEGDSVKAVDFSLWSGGRD